MTPTLVTMKSLFTASIIACISGIASIFAITPSSKAQEYTQTDIDRICGTKMEVAGATFDQFQNASRQASEANAKVDECRERLLASQEKKAEIDAIPTGGTFPNSSVNGMPIQKCSHGGACHGQLMRQLQSGY